MTLCVVSRIAVHRRLGPRSLGRCTFSFSPFRSLALALFETSFVRSKFEQGKQKFGVSSISTCADALLELASRNWKTQRNSLAHYAFALSCVSRERLCLVKETGRVAGCASGSLSFCLSVPPPAGVQERVRVCARRPN